MARDVDNTAAYSSGEFVLVEDTASTNQPGTTEFKSLRYLALNALTEEDLLPDNVPLLDADCEELSDDDEPTEERLLGPDFYKHPEPIDENTLYTAPLTEALATYRLLNETGDICYQKMTVTLKVTINKVDMQETFNFYLYQRKTDNSLYLYTSVSRDENNVRNTVPRLSSIVNAIKILKDRYFAGVDEYIIPYLETYGAGHVVTLHVTSNRIDYIDSRGAIKQVSGFFRPERLSHSQADVRTIFTLLGYSENDKENFNVKFLDIQPIGDNKNCGPIHIETAVRIAEGQFKLFKIPLAADHRVQDNARLACIKADLRNGIFVKKPWSLLEITETSDVDLYAAPAFK